MPIFNPFVPSFARDPYPSYATLRADDPVHFSAALQGWILTRYEDCEQVLRDVGTFSSDPRHARGQLAEILQQQRREFPLGETPSVLNSDPPVHTRLRSIVNRAFTPRMVEGLRPRIEQIAASLLDDARSGTPFELITEFAQPLPIIVIAELLGVPPDDREQLKEWSSAIAQMTNVLTNAQEQERARTATAELVAYFEQIIRERSREPADDLITALVAAEEDGQRLSHEELLSFAILLLLAGHETTTNLIGNGVVALAAHPDQASGLIEDHARIPDAVEELLRYDSPVQGFTRFATSDAELGGKAISTGDTLLVMVGAANRDPARFPEPDVLNVDRAERRHLSFGRGAHFCLGAPLARLEGEIAIRTILDRFGVPRLAEAPEWAGTMILRGCSRIPIETP